MTSQPKKIVDFENPLEVGNQSATTELIIEEKWMNKLYDLSEKRNIPEAINLLYRRFDEYLSEENFSLWWIRHQ